LIVAGEICAGTGYANFWVALGVAATTGGVSTMGSTGRLTSTGSAGRGALEEADLLTALDLGGMLLSVLR